MEIWILVTVGIAILLGACVAWFLRARARQLPPEERRETRAPAVEPQPAEVAPSPASPTLNDRLARTRSSLLSKLGRYLNSSAAEIPPGDWEVIEEALIEGDVGVQTAAMLLGRLKERLKTGNGHGIRELVQEESEALLAGLEHGMNFSGALEKPYVISVVGVNGAGKTTTIGKLSHRFRAGGRSVLLGAGDTFRAAAIQQLEIWANRTAAQFVTGREGADPGAVAFDAVTAGKARGTDIVILDTAGRLHTKSDLMDELKKVHRVIKKVIPEAPHQTWLVLDGTTGQNAIQQAREFQKVLELSGVIITKLDGTAKGGAILAIAAELKLPIKFIGVGEGVEDLVPFEPKPFIQAILGN